MLHFCCSICYSSSPSLRVKRHSLQGLEKNVYFQANDYVEFIKSQTGAQAIDEKDIREAKISRIQSSAQNINVSLTESVWMSLCLRSHTLPVINQQTRRWFDTLVRENKRDGHESRAVFFLF